MTRSLWLLALCLSACQVAGPRADAPTAPASAAPLTIAAPASVAAPAAEGAVTLEVLPQFDALFAPGPTSLNVLVRLKGGGRAAAQRPPLDLAVVIDRSGSMTGDKIRSVKEAALDLLGRLGPADRVTLVSYASDVRVHQTRRPVDEDGRHDLRRDILGLDAAGNTALGPAMMAGLDLLERGDRGDTRIAHLMLLSDGLANEGESRPEALAARAAQAFVRGVSLSTLGVGLDYNEDLMTKLADQGGGRYHFIRDGQAIAGVLGDEMSGLAATVARNVELELAPPAGVRVERVFGYAARHDDGRARVRVGALAAGQTREIVLRLGLDGTSLTLGRFDVRFRDVAMGGTERSLGVEAAVVRAADAAAMLASENAAVAVRVAEVESAERVEIAARATDAGRYDEARQTLRRAAEDLREKHRAAPSPKLARKIDELEAAAAEVQGAASSTEGRKAFTKKYKAQSYDAMK